MRKLLLNITNFVNIIHNVNIINTINIVNISTKSELESAKELDFEAPLPPHTPHNRSRAESALRRQFACKYHVWDCYNWQKHKLS